MLFARPCHLAVALVTVGLCAVIRPAHADIDIVNNLDRQTSQNFLFSSTQWVAASFQTDNQAYTLSSVVLNIDDLNGTGASATVSLYSNSDANKPLANLGDIATVGGIPRNAFTNVTFTPSGTLSLLANTDYWIVARASGNNLRWSYTASNSYTGVGSIPPGFRYGSTTNSGTTWSTASDGDTLLEVIGTATVTPEPGNLALLVGLSGALLAVKRRRERAVL